MSDVTFTLARRAAGLSLGLFLVVGCSFASPPDTGGTLDAGRPVDGSTPTDSPDAFAFECRSGGECGARSDSCVTADQRCECALGAGLAWACEPLACPETDGVDGEACATGGLRCDTGFENPGRVCVGPEMVWASCLYYHRAGVSPPNGCPLDPPTIGSPCCQALPFGGPPPGCMYGGDLYDCVGGHWSLL